MIIAGRREIEQIKKRLDLIIALLDSDVDEQDRQCQHEDLIDLSTMGMKPNQRMECKKCGMIIDKSE